MSGILGLLHFDGAVVSARDLSPVASLLVRRGPELTRLWSDGPVGLGHTLLSSTPQLAWERQPVMHAASGCVITADVRLDNREALLAQLNLSERAAEIGDAGLILEAYLKWGDGCPGQCLGDFAFAIWDPRRRALLCARDPFGMRPFYYHYAPGRFFAFASEPRAILVLPQVPYRINEGRVADYLVPALEWLDYTSTCFDHVYRLPPAEVMTVTASSLNRRRYWTLEPGSELRLPSTDAYAEAMRDVLTKAVRSRLSAAGSVGATLSGGLDSGSVTAVARRLLADQNAGPLATFSGVGPNPETCVETAAIYAAAAMDGLSARLVDYSRLGGLLPALERLTWNADEPFDSTMVLLSAMYVSAQREGIGVVLDGAAGDIVLHEGTHVIRLLRHGRWMTAFKQVSRLDRFHGGSAPVSQSLRRLRAALTPDVARRMGRQALAPRQAGTHRQQSIIGRDFAKRISLVDRFRSLAEAPERAWISDYHQELASVIQQNITAGRERYGRVASAAGVEARDPFLDRRVVEFCVRLPGAQRLHDGWPKVILRRAMAGLLPDGVRWRRGKQHLGWSFRTALLKAGEVGIRDQQPELFEVLRPFVSSAALAAAWTGYFDRGDPANSDHVLTAASLGRWLLAAGSRPVVITGGSC